MSSQFAPQVKENLLFFCFSGLNQFIFGLNGSKSGSRTRTEPLHVGGKGASVNLLLLVLPENVMRAAEAESLLGSVRKSLSL